MNPPVAQITVDIVSFNCITCKSTYLFAMATNVSRCLAKYNALSWLECHYSNAHDIVLELMVTESGSSIDYACAQNVSLFLRIKVVDGLFIKPTMTRKMIINSSM